MWEMCVNETVDGKKRQISIDSIHKLLLPDQRELLDISGIRALLYMKSLDNALRLSRGEKATSAFNMGAFSQGRQEEFMETPERFVHKGDMTVLHILETSKYHMHSQVRRWCASSPMFCVFEICLAYDACLWTDTGNDSPTDAHSSRNTSANGGKLVSSLCRARW
jgi:hypothetical protein